MLEREETDKTKLYEDLPVLTIDETEAQHDLETEYIDENQSGKKTSCQIFSSGEEIQLQNLMRLLDAQPIYDTCIQVAHTIGLRRHGLNLDTEEALARTFSVDAMS